MCDLFPVGNSRRMQFQIHRIGKRELVLSVYALPGSFEGVVALPPALDAWSMSGGEGNGLVEEKQLRIAMRGHHYAVPASKLKNARDPPPALIAPDDFPVRVVQCTTSVAHHRAAGKSPKDVAKRVYAVLQGHPEAHIRRYRRVLQQRVTADSRADHVPTVTGDCRANVTRDSTGRLTFRFPVKAAPTVPAAAPPSRA